MKQGKTSGHPDHYQDVTDRIIENLEKGVRPWNKPWDDNKALSTWPRNATTGHKYRGINILLLMSDPLSFGDDPRWCSYNQAKEQGWQVRKGEKGTRIYFYKTLEVTTGERAGAADGQEEPSTKTIPLLRSYTVFHANQMDGIPPYVQPAKGNEFTPIEEAENLLKNSGAEIHHGGPKAFYSPVTDHIQLPPKEAFPEPTGYYGTALHELSHWTGGRETRVPRNMKGRFGSESYAREELRAEIGSAFICAEIGIPHTIEENASYIASWLKALKEDKHEIFRAASDAQKIADFCLQFAPENMKTIEKTEPLVPVALKAVHERNSR